MLYGAAPYDAAPYADSGESGHRASSDVVMSMFTVAGLAKAKVHAHGAVPMSMFTASAHAIANVEAIGTLTLPMFTISSHAIAPARGRASVIVPMFQMAALIVTAARRRQIRSWDVCTPRPASSWSPSPAVGSLREGEPV